MWATGGRGDGGGDVPGEHGAEKHSLGQTSARRLSSRCAACCDESGAGCDEKSAVHTAIPDRLALASRHERHCGPEHERCHAGDAMADIGRCGRWVVSWRQSVRAPANGLSIEGCSKPSGCGSSIGRFGRTADAPDPAINGSLRQPASGAICDIDPLAVVRKRSARASRWPRTFRVGRSLWRAGPTVA